MPKPLNTENGCEGEALLSAAAELGQQLRNSDEFRSFVAAQQEAETSPRVRAARQQLLKARAAVLEARENNGDVAGAIQSFQLVRGQLQALPEIGRLFTCERQLLGLLEFVARELSDGSGVDFVRACAPVGGCCR